MVHFEAATHPRKNQSTDMAGVPRWLADGECRGIGWPVRSTAPREVLFPLPVRPQNNSIPKWKSWDRMTSIIAQVMQSA